MEQRRWNRRRASWAVSGASALAFAAGCAAPAVAPPAAQAPAADPATVGPRTAGQQFKAVQRDGHLVCTDCGATLNAQGRHRIGDTLVRAVQHMNEGKVFAQAPAAPGKITLKDVIVGGIGRIGHEKLGMKLPGQAEGAAADRVNLFPDPCPDDACWRNYVAANPAGCCVPDGVPIPDPPY